MTSGSWPGVGDAGTSTTAPAALYIRPRRDGHHAAAMLTAVCRFWQYVWNMDKDPEPGTLPASAGKALERLLSRESQISDLIAFLATLDPVPFLAALGLPVRQARVRREVRLGNRAGNADLVVSDEAGPVALLEIKASAAQHSDQFERYATWAKSRTPPVRCYLIALDGESLDAPGGWAVEPSLPQLVRCWQDSSNLHVAWLASAAADIFEGWITQADGKLGCASGPIVGDLVARRIETALLAEDCGPGTGILTLATRQSGGGAAMVLAWLPFPGQPRHPDAWLCADFRSTVRDRPAEPWVLRLGVEVEPTDQVSAAQAKVTAHDLAMLILDALTCTAVQQALRRAGEKDLAAALRPRGRTRDGLPGAPDEQALSKWRANALRPSATAGHPVLAYDNLDNGGYRLASLIEVDVAGLDRCQMTRLILAALCHIQDQAGARQPIGGH